MKRILAFLIFGCTGFAQAKSLFCEIKINNQVVQQTQVQTQLEKKSYISRMQGLSASITELKEDHYVLEAFFAHLDARLYAEGTIRYLQDKIVLSYWGREVLTDIQCFQTSLR